MAELSSNRDTDLFDDNQGQGGNGNQVLDEVAMMKVPQTIDYHYSNGQSTKGPDDNDRSQQVISPDGTSTFDGTSTIGSATSEPTTETASRKSVRSKSSRRKPSDSSRRGGGGADRGETTRNGSSRQYSSRNSGTGNSSNAGGGRRTYRNSYSNSSRNQSSTVPRPYQIKRPGPMSYSKTVRLGGSGNFSAREVDDKTRAVLSDMNDFDANDCETE